MIIVVSTRVAEKLSKLTVSFDVVVKKFAGVSALVCPSEAALSVFTALKVVTLIASAIWPRLQSVPMLLIFLPIALILCSIQMTVCAKAMRLVILPLSVVDVTVSVNETTLTVGLVVSPVALIHRAVRPVLHSLTLSDLTAT